MEKRATPPHTSTPHTSTPHTSKTQPWTRALPPPRIAQSRPSSCVCARVERGGGRGEKGGGEGWEPRRELARVEALGGHTSVVSEALGTSRGNSTRASLGTRARLCARARALYDARYIAIV